RHRRLGRGIAHAETLEIGGLPVAADQQDRAGNLAGGDFVLQERVDARNTLAREAGGCRICADGTFGARLYGDSQERQTGNAGMAKTESGTHAWSSLWSIVFVRRDRGPPIEGDIRASVTP